MIIVTPQIKTYTPLYLTPNKVGFEVKTIVNYPSTKKQNQGLLSGHLLRQFYGLYGQHQA